MTKYDNVELIKFLRGQHWLLMSEREQAEAFANALEAQDKSDSEPSSGEPEDNGCACGECLTMKLCKNCICGGIPMLKPIKPQPESVEKINKLSYGLLLPDELVDKINNALDKLTIIKEDKC